jgi:hypothetical protein
METRMSMSLTMLGNSKVNERRAVAYRERRRAGRRFVIESLPLWALI